MAWIRGWPKLPVGFYGILYIRYLRAWIHLPILHSNGVNKRFERRSYLPAGYNHMIIFKKPEIYSTYICPHITGLRFHRHQPRMQKPFMVFDGIHRTHNGINITFPRKDAHGNRRFKCKFNRVARKASLLHAPVAVGAFFGWIEQHFYFLWIRKVIRRMWISFPVFEKCGLYVFGHMIGNCVLRIFLHMGVDGRINFQSIFIKIVISTICFFVFRNPSITGIAQPADRIGHVIIRAVVIVPFRLISHHGLAQIFSEISSQSAVVILQCICWHIERQQSHRVILFLADIPVIQHLAQNYFAPLFRTLFVSYRWIIGGSPQ